MPSTVSAEEKITHYKHLTMIIYDHSKVNYSVFTKQVTLFCQYNLSY